MKKIVEVWSARTGEFEAKMASLVKKATKLACGSLGYSRLDRVVRKVTNAGGVDEKHSFVRYEVWGNAPQIEGWMFVAALHHTAGGTLVLAMEDDLTVPERYRTATKPVCDHCGTRRSRKDTYLVRHVESGDLKQVGSSCLKDFTGHDSPSKIAAMCDLILAVSGDDFEEGFGFGGGSYYNEYPLLAVLALTAMFVRKEGRYVSNSEAKQAEEEAHWTGRPVPTSTSMMVRHALGRAKLADSTPTDEDETLAKTACEWVGNSMENKSNFDSNLKVAANFELVDDKSLGITCYIVPAYQRHLEREAAAARKALLGDSEWVGTLKKRQVFKSLTVTKMFEIEGYYGNSTVYKFLDENGNVMTWFASNPNINDGEELEVGRTYDLKGTVKDHKEYKGSKETALSRVAFVAAHNKENGGEKAA